MTTDVADVKDAATNPFGSAAVAQRQVNAVAETDQQRAIAETQAAMIIAKRFPRNEIEAMDRILRACTRPTLAEQALYSYGRGGTDITGPSIRLAEALAQSWGNMQFGIRELEQRNGESSVEAFAWDIETNTRQVKVFQVPHTRYSREKGNVRLTDPRDIYEMVANQGARRLRACILGVIPGDAIEAAVKQCDTTLKTKVQITPERLTAMLETFAEWGVTKEMIEKRIQRHLDAITPALFVQLGKVANSLKDGMSSPADWFEMTPTGEGQQTGEAKGATGAAALKVAAEKTARGKAKGKAADANKPAQQGQEQQQAPAGSASLPLEQGQGDKSPVAEVKRICEYALDMKDLQTAFLRLDDARVILPTMNETDKAAAVKEIDAANEELKKRK